MTQSPVPSPKIRIMIVHSQSVIRAGLRSALGGAGPFEVVAEAGDGIAALLAMRQHNPTVAILEMSGGTSVIAEETMLRLRADNPDLHFLIYMSPENPLAISELFASGAYGFISQSADSGEIMTAVRAVTSGGTYIPSHLTRALIAAGKSVLKGNAYDLTHREAEILSLIGEGMSNKEIANRLDVSVRTIETHRLSIRRKTSANTLSDLVRAARSVARQDEQRPAEKAV
jgi:two-component system, NarL family, nitrate/nitrite response regulator NarL